MSTQITWIKTPFGLVLLVPNVTLVKGLVIIRNPKLGGTCAAAFLVPLFVSLVVTPVFGGKKEDRTASLIEHAKQISDIRADGAPAFRMELDFKITREDGTALQGVYTETWVSKLQWRRETALGGFHRIELASGSKRWKFDSATVAPDDVGDVAYLVDMGRLRPELWKSRRDRSFNGVRMDCLESAFGASANVCFDKANGALAADIRPGRLASPSGARVCFLSDYQKFSDRTLARSYECNEGKQRKLEARIVELTSEPLQNAALFVPPEGARETVNCLGTVKPPKVIYQEDPQLPLRNFRGTVIVAISLIVGADGKPHDLKVTSVPNPRFDTAALEAVRRWKFSPATCDGEPMQTEIAVETEFHLE